jgi:hypothetical protein
MGAAGQRARSFRFRSMGGLGRGHGLTQTPAVWDGDGTAAVSADPATTPIVDRQFEIEFLEAGVEAFSFTFG